MGIPPLAHVCTQCSAEAASSYDRDEAARGRTVQQGGGGGKGRRRRFFHSPPFSSRDGIDPTKLPAAIVQGRFLSVPHVVAPRKPMDQVCSFAQI